MTTNINSKEQNKQAQQNKTKQAGTTAEGEYDKKLDGPNRPST